MKLLKFIVLWTLSVLWIVIANAVFDYWMYLGHAPIGSSLLIGSFHMGVLISLMWAILHIFFKVKP